MKFSGFQDLYFSETMPGAFNIQSDPRFINRPKLVMPADTNNIPGQGAPLGREDFNRFAEDVSKTIAQELNLTTSL
jgi:threonine synthase